MRHLKLKILEGQFSIHKLSINDMIPYEVYQSDFYSIVKTDDELSIVCDSSIPFQTEKSNSGWTCIKVIGPLDFSLTGILSEISAVLANSKISIFTVSTYATDYILVEISNIINAKQALIAAGYTFVD